MGEMQESRGVERRVGSMWWEGERESGCYEAVERCVKGPGNISTFLRVSKLWGGTYRVAALISPDSDTGNLDAASLCSSLIASSCFPSISVNVVGRTRIRYKEARASNGATSNREL
jgi:hypothetical protein